MKYILFFKATRFKTYSIKYIRKMNLNVRSYIDLYFSASTFGAVDVDVRVYNTYV